MFKKGCDCSSYVLAQKSASYLSDLSSKEKKKIGDIEIRKIDPNSFEFSRFCDFLDSSWAKNDFSVLQVKEIWVSNNVQLNNNFKYYKSLLNIEDEMLCWHGSSQKNLFNILKTGFLYDKVGGNVTNFARFGSGFYFSLNSSKSHEYSIGRSRNYLIGQGTRDWNNGETGLLLCRIAIGKVKRYKTNQEKLLKPPNGFHSVEGCVGNDLNFHELVVYEEKAVLPVCLITYYYRQNF